MRIRATTFLKRFAIGAAVMVAVQAPAHLAQTPKVEVEPVSFIAQCKGLIDQATVGRVNFTVRSVI